MNRHITAAAAVFAALSLALSACGGSSDSRAATGSNGLTALRVTTLGLCEEVGLFAKDGGFFKKHGLDVSFVPATGGNAGVAALQGGAADVVFVSSAAAFAAMAQGVDLTIVSGAVRTGPQTNGVIVKADSLIRGPGDLAGKKVGVLELSGQSATSTKTWIAAARPKPEIKLVQLPVPELVPAVVSGTIDGALVTASEIQQVTQDGTGRSIGNALYEVAGGSTPTGMYAASSGFVTKNQKAMKDFVAAMQEAADQANDPADTEHLDVASTYCKKPAADLAKIPQDGRPVFEGYVDRASFMRVVDVVHDVGTVPADFHPETKVASFAWVED